MPCYRLNSIGRSRGGNQTISELLFCKILDKYFVVAFKFSKIGFYSIHYLLLDQNFQEILSFCMRVSEDVCHE